jgi:hypothetical protein
MGDKMLRVFLYAAFVLLLGLDAAIFLKTGAPEPRVACGSEYTVEPGDTLYDIAQWAYGDPLMYREIYGANGDLLRNERTINIGDKILIPCLDDADARSHPDAEAPELAAEVHRRTDQVPDGFGLYTIYGQEFDRRRHYYRPCHTHDERSRPGTGFPHQLHQ